MHWDNIFKSTTIYEHCGEGGWSKQDSVLSGDSPFVWKHHLNRTIAYVKAKSRICLMGEIYTMTKQLLC